MGTKWTLHVMMLPRRKLDISPCKTSIIHQHVPVAFGLEFVALYALMHTTYPLLIGHGYRSQHISHGSKHLICSSLILLQSLHSSPTPSKSFPPIIPLSRCDLWSPTLTQSSSLSLSLCPLFLLSACFLFLQLSSRSTLPQFGAEPPQPALFYPDTQETSCIWITDPEREDHFFCLSLETCSWTGASALFPPCSSLTSLCWGTGGLAGDVSNFDLVQ